jgi:hypothetical protein
MTGSGSPITSIFAGSRCVGFTFAKGPARFEAFDEYRGLELQADQPGAIAAVAVAASTPTQEEHPCVLETSTDGVQRR